MMPSSVVYIHVYETAVNQRTGVITYGCIEALAFRWGRLTLNLEELYAGRCIGRYIINIDSEELEALELERRQ